MKKIILVFITCLFISFQSQAQIEVATLPMGYIVGHNNFSINANLNKQITLEYSRKNSFGNALPSGDYYKQNQIALRYYLNSNDGGFFGSIYLGNRKEREYIYEEREKWVSRSGGSGFNVISFNGLYKKTFDVAYNRIVTKNHLGFECGYRWKFYNRFFVDATTGLQKGFNIQTTTENWQGEQVLPKRYMEFPIKFNLRIGVRFGK